MHGVTAGNNNNLPSVHGEMFVLPGNFAAADAGTDKLIATDNYYRLQLTHRFNDHMHLFAQVAYVHGTWAGISWMLIRT